MNKIYSREKSQPIVKIMAYTIAVILVLLPFHAFITTWAGATFGHIDIFRIWKEILSIFLLGGVGWLIFTDSVLRKGLYRSIVFRLIGIYILLTILRTCYGLIGHHVTTEAALFGLVLNLRYLIFFIIVFVVSSKTSFLQRRWPHILLFSAGTVTLYGILQQFILPKDFLTHFGYGSQTVLPYQTIDKKPEYIRAQSLLRGPNPLGAYLVFIITALLGIWVFCKSKRFFIGGLTFLSVVLMLFTYSRSAWLGLLASVVVFGLLTFGKRHYVKRVLQIGLVTAVVVAGSVYLLRDNNIVQNTIFHTDENSQSRQSSNAERTEGIMVNAKDAVTHPFGRGAGTAGPASQRNNGRVRIAENYYIQIAQEIGIAGLIIYLTIIVIIASELWYRRSTLLGGVLFASLLGILVINMLSHAWADDTLSMLWWGLAGIAMTLKPVQHQNKKNNSRILR